MLQEKKQKNKKFDYLFVAIIGVTIMPEDDVGAIVYYGFTTADGMFTYFIFLNHGSGSAFCRYPGSTFYRFQGTRITFGSPTKVLLFIIFNPTKPPTFS